MLKIFISNSTILFETIFGNHTLPTKTIFYENLILIKVCKIGNQKWRTSIINKYKNNNSTNYYLLNLNANICRKGGLKWPERAK